MTVYCVWNSSNRKFVRKINFLFRASISCYFIPSSIKHFKYFM
nr:MAG TPA: hypothetical protein [Caudoviricetes sp.]